MGGGGTEWETADNFDNLRLNQKTLFIGNENQLNNMSTTYPGQMAMLTSSGATYLREKRIVRNASNTAWSSQKIHTTSGSLGTVGTGGAAPNLRNAKIYHNIDVTFPTSEKYYIITNFQFNTELGSANYGFVGADILNGNHSTLVALGFFSFSTPGLRTVDCMSKTIRGGTSVSLWISGDNTMTSAVLSLTGTRRSKEPGWNATPKYGEEITITTTSSVSTPGLKINYLGYS